MLRRLIATSLVCLSLTGMAPVGVESETGLDEAVRTLQRRIVEDGHVYRRVDEDALLRQVQAASSAEAADLLFRHMGYVLDIEGSTALAAAARRLQASATAAGSPSYASVGRAYGHFAVALTGRYEAALNDLDRELAQARSRGDWLAVASGLRLRALILTLQGQVRPATRSLEDAFDLLPRQGRQATWLRAELLIAFAFVNHSFADVGAMVRRYQAAIDASLQAGRPIEGQIMLFNIGHALLRRGEHLLARDVFRALHGLGPEVPRSVQYGLMGLADVEHELGNYSASALHAESVLNGEPLFAHTRARLNQTLALNYLNLGRIDEARALLAQTEARVAEEPALGQSEYGATNLLIRSGIAKVEGDLEGALRLHRQHAAVQDAALKEKQALDIQSVRAKLESQLERERAERDVANRDRQLALEQLRVQRLWLIVAFGAAFLLLAGLVWQRRLARVLDESRKAAEQATLAKSRFLASMSHELRTPLNAVIGFSQMVADETQGPVGSPTYRDYARAIHRAGRHLLSVINNILSIARAEAGRLQLCEETVSVADIVAQAVEEVAGRAAERRQQIVLEGVDAAPELYADARLLRQALAGLLCNAVKFGGAEPIRVRAATDEDGSLRLEVQDRGIGMSAVELETALQPFGQVQSVMTRGHEGAGLGLPLARMFVEAHGGRLEVRSEKGGGTLAALVLPSRRVRSSAAGDDASRAEGASLVSAAVAG